MVSMKKEEYKEHTDYQYNEGRLSADRKWVEAIDNRIKELEEEAGIPELRRLKEKTRFRWHNESPQNKLKPTKSRFHN